MDTELLKMEIYTKAINIQTIISNNLDIACLIKEADAIKKLSDKLKEEN